jgi:hypothetical protein
MTLSEPQVDWPQATVTGTPPGPAPLHWHGAQAWPVEVKPAALQA